MSHQRPTIDALLPAGGRVSGEFAAAGGAEVKALIEFGGITILETTIRALQATPDIGRIVVVGPEPVLELARSLNAEALPERSTGSENILLGLEWLTAQPNPSSRTGVITTDMPFITAESLTSFFDASPADRDVCISLIERDPFEKEYPGLIRTDSRLADGWFRLGGAFVLDAQQLLRNRTHLEQVFEARKSNVRLAKLIGAGIVVRYVTRTLTSAAILRRAEQILGCTGHIIKDADPALAFDIDLLEEYRYAKKYFDAGNGREAAV